MTWKPAQPDDALLADELVRIGLAQDKRATAAFALYSSGLFRFADVGELLGVGAARASQMHGTGRRLMRAAISDPQLVGDGKPGHAAGRWFHKSVCGCARCVQHRKELAAKFDEELTARLRFAFLDQELKERALRRERYKRRFANVSIDW